MKIALTGSNGFVGSCLGDYLGQKGYEIIGLCRSPQKKTDRKFFLGMSNYGSLFENIDVLIHCAYDFSAKDKKEIFSKNVAASIDLFKAAKNSGVKKIIFISSISAFKNCKSLYGTAKWKVEEFCLENKITVVRPGLIFSDLHNGGMFQKLERIANKFKILPYFVMGEKRLLLCNALELSNTLEYLFLSSQIFQAPIIVIQKEPTNLKELLTNLAIKNQKTIFFIPFPWQFAWLGLKFIELMKIKIPFTSDNLLGMVTSNNELKLDK